LTGELQVTTWEAFSITRSMITNIKINRCKFVNKHKLCSEKANLFKTDIGFVNYVKVGGKVSAKVKI
jgi:hypothetical protein